MTAYRDRNLIRPITYPIMEDVGKVFGENGIYDPISDEYFMGPTTNWSAGTLDTTFHKLDLSLAGFGATNLLVANCLQPQLNERWVAVVDVTVTTGKINLRDKNGAQTVFSNLAVSQVKVVEFTASVAWGGYQLIAPSGGFTGSINRIQMLKLS